MHCIADCVTNAFGRRAHIEPLRSVLHDIVEKLVQGQASLRDAVDVNSTCGWVDVNHDPNVGKEVPQQTLHFGHPRERPEHKSA